MAWDFWEWWGLVAGGIGAVAFLPQIAKVLVTRDVEGLSTPTFAFLTLMMCMWLVYGIARGAPALIIVNAIGAAENAALLAMTIAFRKPKT